MHASRINDGTPWAICYGRSSMGTLEFRRNLLTAYSDVYTPDVLRALDALAPLDEDRRTLMMARIARRAARSSGRDRIRFRVA